MLRWGLCLEKHGALKHQMGTSVWVLNDFSSSNSPEPWEPRRNCLSNMHLTNLLLHERNSPCRCAAYFPFKRMIYKEIRWCGHPPAAVSPNCRVHTSNNLFGMLPAKDWAWHGYRNIAITLWRRTLTGKFEKILASGEPQSELHCSLSPLIQSCFLFLLLQMSDLHCISESLPPSSCSHIPVILTVFPKVFPFDACFLEEPNEHASSNLMDADFDISSQMIWTF